MCINKSFTLALFGSNFISSINNLFQDKKNLEKKKKQTVKYFVDSDTSKKLLLLFLFFFCLLFPFSEIKSNILSPKKKQYFLENA